MSRRTDGDETWARLLGWMKGSKEAERLSAQILRAEGYSSIDPSHPLGGPDGLKDVTCRKDNLIWIGASYFPRGQKSPRTITAKFKHDLEGIKTNNAQGIAFVTNQELSLGQREGLKKLGGTIEVDLFHLERISGILDSPAFYGVRLDFLDLNMTKEEQLAYIAFRDGVIAELQGQLQRVLNHLEEAGLLKSIPLAEIKEFKKILESIAGYDSANPFAHSLYTIPSASGLIRNLYVPLRELKEFEVLLRKITGISDPYSITTHSVLLFGSAPIHSLQVPLNILKDYETTLDQVIEKLKLASALQQNVIR